MLVALKGSLAITLAVGLGPQIAHGQSAPSAFTKAYRYDVGRRVSGTISPDPDGNGNIKYAALRNSYDASGRLISVETGELSAWQSEAIAPSSWGGSSSEPASFVVFKTVEISYDVFDRKVKEVARAQQTGTISAVTQYSYDAVGRLQCTAIRMDPSKWSAQSDVCAPQTSGPNGPDRITKNVYDAAGQLLQVRKAVGTSLEQAYVTYSYTPNGKQEYVVDANGNRARMVYDGFDRQVAWLFPSTTPPSAFDGSTPALALSTAGGSAACTIGTVADTIEAFAVPGGGTVNVAVTGPSEARATGDDCEKYSYDRNGNRAKLMKRDGSVIRYSYDALNRMFVKAIPQRAGLPASAARSVYYGYDLRGLQTSATFADAEGGWVSNTWDGLGRQTSSTLSMDGVGRKVSYEYDADGNRTRVTLPDGNYTTYSYDGLDRPLTISRSGTATVASYMYDAAGRRCKMESAVTTTACDTAGSAVAVLYGYDGIGRVTSIKNALTNATYTNTYGFQYNPASQIREMTKSNTLYSFAGTSNVNRPYTVNGLNQYTDVGAATNATHFDYDGNGNLTGDKKVTAGPEQKATFLYDIENRLVSAGGTRNVALRYDPLGRLYESAGPSGTVRFLYDGDALVGEYDTGGTLLRRYVHGADGAADDPIAWYEGSAFGSGNERLLRPDWQGSIALVSDNAGSSVFGVNTYDEYGYPGSNNIGRFQYTGQAWLPDLGMYYYKARIYSPTLARLIQ